MKRISMLLALALAVLLPATAISAAPEDHDHQVFLEVGDSASVAGGLPGGVNTEYFGGLAGDLPSLPSGPCADDPTGTACETAVTAANEVIATVNAQGPAPGQCTSDPTTYCESVFIEVSNPLTVEEIEAGVTSKRESLDIVLTPTHPVADFDLVLYTSNADGEVLGSAGQSGGAPIADDQESQESIFQTVTTTEENPSRYYVAHVVYFAAPSDYTLDVDFF